MKKTVAIVICILLCVVLGMSLIACDETTEQEFKPMVEEAEIPDVDDMEPTEGLEYHKTLFTYTVTGIGSATDVDIVIPQYVGRIPVIGIDSNAFAGNSDIESVWIPSTVVNIDSKAFNDCQNLKKFTVSKYNLTYRSEGECIIRRDNGKLICGCNNSVIPNDGTVTSIGEDAFRDCKRLYTFTIPAGITEIGDYAFFGCDKLVEIFNNSALEMIYGTGDNGFVAKYARYILVDGDASQLDFTKNDMVLLKNSTGYSLINYSGDKSSLTLPENITEICYCAFVDSKNLQSIKLPKSLTVLGYNAFDGCTELKSVEIGKNVKEIGKYTFINCTALESVSLSEGMEIIPDGMFYGCTKLVNVTIPSTVKRIGEWAFRNCESVTAFYIPESVNMIGRYAFVGCTELKTLEFEDTDNWYRIDAKYENYASWENFEGGEPTREGELDDIERNAKYFRNDFGNYDYYWYKK